MTFRVLFVCAANICRSPTASRIFVGQLRAELAGAVVAESAGISAEPGLPWCEEAHSWVVDQDLAVGDMLEHRSRRLTAAKMTRVDLILAADTDIKSAVLRLDLAARSRLFTLVEAAALASGVQAALAAGLGCQPDRVELELEPFPSEGVEDRLHWLVNEMDAARGLVVPTDRRGRACGADLPDPHSGRVKATHRDMLKTLTEAVSSLNATWSSIVAV